MAARPSMRTKSTPASAPAAPAWFLPTAWMGLLASGWAVVVLYLYLPSAPINLPVLFQMVERMAGMPAAGPYAIKMLKGLFTAVWLVWLSYQLGNGILRYLLRISDLTAPERWALGSVLGLGVIGLGTLGLGAVGA